MDMVNLASVLVNGPRPEPYPQRTALDVLADALLVAVADAHVIDRTWARKTAMELVNKWHREISK